MATFTRRRTMPEDVQTIEEVYNAGFKQFNLETLLLAAKNPNNDIKVRSLALLGFVHYHPTEEAEQCQVLEQLRRMEESVPRQLEDALQTAISRVQSAIVVVQTALNVRASGTWHHGLDI